MDPLEELPKAEIVYPTEQEASEGLARLETCIPHWKQSPALLIEKPHLALIVSLTEYAADNKGFRLGLAITEELRAPRWFNLNSLETQCSWNQPYLSFGRDGIHAPYSFSLYFGTEGVDRAREVAHLLNARVGTANEVPWDFALLRSCFDANGEQHLASVREWLQNPS